MKTSQKNFIESIANEVKTGKILKSLIIAQAILETGWGKYHIHNNYFGIKAHSGWDGKVYNAKTFEVYEGVREDINADFRAYNSLSESVADYEDFILGVTRYKAVIGEKDYKKACKAIHDAGYATAPNYADTLISLIEQYKLYEYDVVKSEDKPQVNKPIEVNYKNYTVKSGDSFWSIAQAQMGNGSKYKDLAEYNGLKSTAIIHAGQVLKIPTSDKANKPTVKPALKSVDVIAREVIKGLWGNGTERKDRLTKAGYDYVEVQLMVNSMV